MSVYLDSVSIAGIMGIPNELSLDLTAPLTLVYAPNGTGKTSAWTAVKALMSMGVSDEIACRASGSKAPRVSGSLLIGGDSYTAAAAVGKLTLVDRTGDKLSGTTALTRLAPEVDITGVQTKGGVLKERLISQIEACRFLPSDSLLYLIDNGEESTELRRKLFADLTGTSAIQSEARETKRYRDKLSGEVTSVKRELETIERQLQAFAVAHNPSSSDPLHLIMQAALVAGIQLPPELPPQDALFLLRETQTTRGISLETSRAAFATWSSIDSAYPTLDRDFAVASGALESAKAAHEHARQTLARAQSEIDVSSAKRAHQQYVQFQQGLAKVAGLVAAEGRTKRLTGFSVTSLRQLLQSYDSEYAIESRLDALNRLNSSRLTYRDWLAERDDLIEQKRQLLAELHDPARAIQTRLNEKTAKRSDLVANLNRQADLATSLRAGAESIVTASQSSTCPCCSHHWSSVDALLAAIAAGDQAGSGDARLKQELDALEAAIEQLRVQYAKANTAEGRLRDQEARLAELNASIERIEHLATASDIAPARLLEPVDTLEEVNTLRSLHGIWRLLEVLDGLDGGHNEDGSVEEALSALGTRSEALKTAATKSEQVEVERKLTIEREQSGLTYSVDHERQCQERLLEITHIKQQRDAAIEQLKLNGLFADAQVSLTLNGALGTLEKLGSLITQISAAVEASAAVAARERIATNQKALRARERRILDEIQLSNRLVELLADSEEQAGQRFFDQLGPAVETLFDHMQVNRVFRSLKIRAIKKSFRLDGQLDDDVSLDPGLHFSQGQRQDLALSMFLVRAASLGGSFFLDEPLVHLDDLNRTALLDCLRACVLGTSASLRPVRLVVTTATWSVARLLMQKFYGVQHTGAGPFLRVIQLSGNVRSRVEQSVVFPVGDMNVKARYH